MVELDGSKIRDLDEFIAAVVADLSRDGEGYFGWDLYSLQDCLRGGYLGEPPYNIRVVNAEPMVQAFGQAGAIADCERMLGVIDSAGRGMVKEDARGWFESLLQKARTRTEHTLLGMLLDMFLPGSDCASLILIAGDGEILADSRDPNRTVGDTWGILDAAN